MAVPVPAPRQRDNRRVILEGEPLEANPQKSVAFTPAARQRLLCVERWSRS